MDRSSGRAIVWVVLLAGAALILLAALLRVAAVAGAPAIQAGGFLPDGQPVRGSIDDSSFRQVYSFDARANEVIAISMTRLSGQLDPYILLTDGVGTILALSDDDGPNLAAQIRFTRIPAEGRYFVIATRFGQELGTSSGDYELLLERVGTTAIPNTVLQYGESVFGRVTADEPLVFYFVRAERGDIINIVMRRTSGDLDPQLDLSTSDGTVLASNDDDPSAEGTLDAAITNHTIFESGVYVIVATRFGHEAGTTEGSFVLSYSRTPPESLGTSLETARLIDYGATLTSSISAETPSRYYYFQARRGDVISISATSVAGGLDPFLTLLDTNLIELITDDDSGGQRNARLAGVSLPVSGTYYVIVTRHGGLEGRTNGEFALELNGRPGVAGGRALEIAYGATVSGQINAANVAEEYVFFGRRGDVIRVRLERASGDLDALITLYDSDRKQIAFDDDSGGDKDALIQNFVLPRDDLYSLVASRFERERGNTAGAYVLRLELVRAAD